MLQLRQFIFFFSTEKRRKSSFATAATTTTKHSPKKKKKKTKPIHSHSIFNQLKTEYVHNPLPFTPLLIFYILILFNLNLLKITLSLHYYQ